ncbi:hypothetical protein AOL_s00188g81 [Orbilia oligospora ATCC 24927]|uniref:Uncharacterized protein n=1 Tax=Arthrobotrys oligospora (strain ATCC 24927 / CBS 115.81 / DSM 1491) TaxID=756982 RepID=G1XQ70_ARTOA|nr:hypothetical protein AOL_s00188g81 [Orbilia oligospora ATCC 24927]EGX44743.1 hypothetical protein AOL_s00188g81 [Orbilia oligospora ATCC 24927]
MTTATPSIPPKVTIIDSIPTIDISSNSSIRKKVSQCLSVLQIQPSSSSSSSSTTTGTTTTTAVEPQGKKKKASSKKSHPKIIALRTVHPSAGSKVITVAEIVKRCIADPPTDGSGGNTRKGVWWQYTKLESKLIELPPRKPMVVKEGDTLKKDKKKDDTKPDRNVKDKRKQEPEPTTNANKRKQDGQESRASKRPKLDLSQNQNVDSTIEGSAPKSNSKKRRRDKSEGTDEDSNDDDDIPPHLKENNDLESDDDIPPHLRDATDDMDTDDVPPHLRQSSPDDIPPHLRNSTPGLYSDTKPGFLRDSTPDNGGGGGSDDIPPHLRGSSPFKDRDGSSTPKPIPTQGEDQTLTSSPPSLSTETPTKAQEEHNNEDKNEDKNSDSDEDEDDGYRQFSYLDIEHLPEKHTKRILEDIDEAERNRKKYRAIAIMTIYISLEKHGDFEKLYGGQTNEGEKKKKQEVKEEGKSK